MPNNSDADRLANQLRTELAKQEIESDHARFLEVKDGKDTYRVRTGPDAGLYDLFDTKTGEEKVISTSTLTNMVQESLDNGARVTAKDGPDFGPGKKRDKDF